MTNPAHPRTTASAAPTTAVTLAASALGFAWPDGRSVFDGLNLTVPPGRTGLVGVNGTGKSTLLRLLAGQLRPARGSVTVGGSLAYLPQDATLDTALRVDQALGIAERRAALLAIESGDPDPRHFDAVGDDWDIEERTVATLGSLGLGSVGLDRTVGELSGGETILLRLAALLLARPDVLLLDEPTNNLDLFARRRLYAAVDNWNGGGGGRGILLVVSHDRELLERVDRIAELRTGPAALSGSAPGEVAWFGGGWSAYQEAVAAQQEAAHRALSTADADLRKQKRELEEAEMKSARRARAGRQAAASGKYPPIVAGNKRRAAQVSAGKMKGLHEDRLQDARDRREQAADAIRADAEIRVDLPHTAVHPGRTVLTLDGLTLAHGTLHEADLSLHGPERVALVGRNGAGKTTLLRTVAGTLAPAAGSVKAHVPLRFLPQRLDILDEAASVVENTARLAPELTGNEIRAQLARFLFRGARADQPIRTLSGGERFRAALAATMLAAPAPQLLLFDEPTNNLDAASVRQLTAALESYRGALVVASHDLPFLAGLGITRWFLVGDELTETTEEGIRELLGA